MKKLNINVVSYVDAFITGAKGGGEMINEALLNELSTRSDVDLRYFSVYSRVHHRFFGSKYSSSCLHTNSDLNILIDIYNIPHFINRINKNLISKLLTSNYIHLDNSYVDVCSKAFLPCNGSSDCNICERESRIELYRNSKMNFFLSPMHRDIVLNLLKLNVQASVLPPFLDLENLPSTLDLVKDIEYLYVGTISEYKGYKEIEKQFGHIGDEFMFVGPKSSNLNLFSKNYIPWASRKDVFSFMLRAKRFVHLPSWKEPMGRTVLEASLCGCEIIGNSNVGALSFDFDISKRSFYEDSVVRAVSMLLKYAN